MGMMLANLVHISGVNEPGLPALVQQLQTEKSILGADSFLPQYLTELLQREPWIGWLVRYTMAFLLNKTLKRCLGRCIQSATQT
jgi:hypothetical protein